MSDVLKNAGDDVEYLAMPEMNFHTCNTSCDLCYQDGDPKNEVLGLPISNYHAGEEKKGTSPPASFANNEERELFGVASW